jgi:hypothetical protein
VCDVKAVVYDVGVESVEYVVDTSVECVVDDKK